MYLRDRDELSPEVLARLAKSPAVNVLGRRELENYLLDPDAVAAVIRPLTASGISAPAPAAIAADRRRGCYGSRPLPTGCAAGQARNPLDAGAC